MIIAAVPQLKTPCFLKPSRTDAHIYSESLKQRAEGMYEFISLDMTMLKEVDTYFHS